MTRFYVSPESIKKGKITITGQEQKHIVKVLRCKVGDMINITDGTGKEYKARIIEKSKISMTAKIISKVKIDVETKVKLILYQSIIRSEQMSWLIQKATELGIHSIILFCAQRSQYKPGKDKISRWQKIAQSAACQSGRTFVPEVGHREFSEILSELSKNDLNLVFSLDKNAKKINLIINKKTYKKIGLFIGPEGDFTAQEINKLKNSGAKAVSLGSRILRSETAVVSAVSLVLYQLGEI